MKTKKALWLKYAVFLSAVLFLILWTGNFFNFSLIKPGTINSEDLIVHLNPKGLFLAKAEIVPVYEVALGVVESKRRTTVSSQITGQVVQVLAEPSDFVQKGGLLVKLDDRELKAKYTRVKSHFERIKKLYQAKAATKAQFEEALSQFTQTEVALSYTRITAPFSGIVSEKIAEPGDLAWPGKELIKMYDPGSLRIAADIREGLVKVVKKGDVYTASVPSVGLKLKAQASEIVPSADPGSRTLRVHMDLLGSGKLYPGMFAKVFIPVREKKAVLIPESAVRKSGQLEFVWVKDRKGFRRRLIKTGKFYPGRGIEILSGLRGSENIAVF